MFLNIARNSYTLRAMAEIARNFSRGSTHLVYYRYTIACCSPPFFARVTAVRERSVDVVIFRPRLVREYDEGDSHMKYYMPREDTIAYRARIRALTAARPIICVVGSAITLNYAEPWNGEPVLAWSGGNPAYH